MTPLIGTTFSTASIPLVIVPVLSKAIVLANESCSKVVPVLTIIPLRLERLIPEIKAIGAAKINGQGEATTKTSAKRIGSLETNQAIEAIKYAKSVGAEAIAHGSTGAGNDQIRFDLIFQTIAPEIEIITPIRDLKLSRQEEVDYLSKNGVHYSWEKAQYSINKGLWGTSVGGKETLTSHQALPSEAYPSQLTKEGEEKVTLTFKKGELVAVNGKADKPSNNIVALEKLANAFAIGRDTHVGDTIIGIKGRVGFEAAAPLIIIKAHHLLEKHTLGKWQQYWKEQLGNWYGMLFHEGQFLDPVMRNIEAFLEDTQKTVNGTVTVSLKPYHFSLDGIESENDLMNTGFGQYGEMNNAWTADDAKGFIKILGNAQNIFSSVNNETYE